MKYVALSIYRDFYTIKEYRHHLMKMYNRLTDFLKIIKNLFTKERVYSLQIVLALFQNAVVNTNSSKELINAINMQSMIAFSTRVPPFMECAHHFINDSELDPIHYMISYFR